MARWWVLVTVLVTCLLPCCAGIVKVANERDGTDDVLFDSAEVLTINRLPVLLKKLTEGGSYGNLNNVEVWLENYSLQLENLTQTQALAWWNYATNVTDEHAEQSEEVEKEAIQWTELQMPDARRFYYFFKRCYNGLAPCKPKNITYALRVIVNTQSSAAPQNKTLRNEMVHLSTELQSIYSKAKLTKAGKTYQLEPGLTKLMGESRDYDELVWAWTGWRNVTGRKMRTLFDRFVHLQNLGATDIGLHDAGEHWRISNYDMNLDLEKMVDKLFHQIKPLYKLLHAYVRRKLREQYPGRIGPRDPIPAHLLGNMWAQQWNDIYSLVIPFPDVAPIDVSDTMRAQNYTPARMFRVAESFYTSIGLDPMTQTFWEKSMITRPTDGREVVCHAAAEDFYNGDDYRIKMCTEVNQDDLTTIHHEMGHIEYFMQYHHQNPIFRGGANAAFHEAVGDTIALSVMTPGHLQKIGLLNASQAAPAGSRRGERWDKREINFLMKMALEKIAFLPFGYLIDKYRWDVFRGTINNDNYNAKWWEYRLKYQGIAPPVPRSEEDFDPGAKYHVAANVPYMRYFLSFLGQFQFHKALCKEAGNFEKLHECDIYESRQAGQRLKEALSLGSSKPWPEVMRVLTGQPDFSASAIQEYFGPLISWLREQNRGQRVGWDGEAGERVVDEDNDDTEVQELLKALLNNVDDDSGR